MTSQDCAIHSQDSPILLLPSLLKSIERVLEGKQEIVELAVVALLAGGHLLLEDIPGVGKTSLARSLAKATGLPFRRVQFTSDLLPSDIIGGSIYDPRSGELRFRPGPIFTSVFLADEINRASPRTQSALLEAMEEHRVSIDGETHILPSPFWVVATQNPEDFHGTQPLPESQLDRFLLRLEIGHPPTEVERRILRERKSISPIDTIQPVLNKNMVIALQSLVDQVEIVESVLQYAHDLILTLRRSPLVEVGPSTRAALALLRAVRAYALLRGRTYVTPDDVKRLAIPVLAHR
ncbi:MAG: MoxR family ATPase, partial [Sandaracinaceae bacterium]|nr:MoxR family ATPase [Sandaracinaceae bacterium]